MKEIIKEIEYISMKLNEIKSNHDLLKDHSMNLLYWKWHEERRGMIRACEMLGMTITVTDMEGLKWKAEV